MGRKFVSVLGKIKSIVRIYLTAEMIYQIIFHGNNKVVSFFSTLDIKPYGIFYTFYKMQYTNELTLINTIRFQLKLSKY